MSKDLRKYIDNVLAHPYIDFNLLIHLGDFVGRCEIAIRGAYKEGYLTEDARDYYLKTCNDLHKHNNRRDREEIINFLRVLQGR